MARNILLDGQIINEINRGNTTAARTLLELKKSGANIELATQSNWELTVNNPQKEEAAANGFTLKELGFRVAGPGEAAARQDFLVKNTGKNQAIIQDGLSFAPPREGDGYRASVENKGVGNLRDAAIAAQAYALDYEVLSGERGFNTTRQREFDKVFNKRLKMAPENSALVASKAPSRVTNYQQGRALLGLPPMNVRQLPSGQYEPVYPGRGGQVPSMNTGTPGYDPEGSSLRAMGVIMTVGVIVGWLDEKSIKRDSDKDINDWERHIGQRQNLDPEIGYLIVVIVKVWQPRDAAYPTKSYVGLEVVEAYNMATANAKAAKDILPGLPPPTDTISYEYRKLWINPVRPRKEISSEESDEKAFGKEQWYPRYRMLMHSLIPPPDYGEAIGVLQGSSMWDILRVLDHVKNPQYNQLKDKLSIVREPVNRAILGLAFRAVENHRSDSARGLRDFLADRRNAEDYALISEGARKEIDAWVQTAPGAHKHAIQGQWKVAMGGKYWHYSFRLDGKVTWRDWDNQGPIGGEGNWEANEGGIRINWPKTGTLELLPGPIKSTDQKGKSVTKWNGTMEMSMTNINPYP